MYQQIIVIDREEIKGQQLPKSKIKKEALTAVPGAREKEVDIECTPKKLMDLFLTGCRDR